MVVRLLAGACIDSLSSEHLIDRFWRSLAKESSLWGEIRATDWLVRDSVREWFLPRLDANASWGFRRARATTCHGFCFVRRPRIVALLCRVSIVPMQCMQIHSLYHVSSSKGRACVRTGSSIFAAEPVGDQSFLAFLDRTGYQLQQAPLPSSTHSHSCFDMRHLLQLKAN